MNRLSLRRCRLYGPTLLIVALATATCSLGRCEQPAGSAVVPTQQRGMLQRHEQKVEAARSGKYDLLLIGDSITHNLDLPRYKQVWDRFYAPRRALDLGYSGARTENILWNLANGELANQSPRAAVVLIGTNNSDDANYPVVHTPEQIAAGTRAIVELLRKRLPETKILLLRVFPRTNVYKKGDVERGNARKRFETNLRASELVAKLADGKMVHDLDLNHVFLRLDGSIDPELMPDRLHPSPRGAIAWAEAMEPKLSELMGDQRRDTAACNSALVPATNLENDSYDWNARHEEVLKLKDALRPEIVMIGDSITHFWGGPPQAHSQRGPQAWKELFGNRPVLNLGFGWDRTQNVLWRLDHGEFGGLHPRWVVINIGTNNFSQTAHAQANTPAQVAEGIRAICVRIRSKSPESRIVLMGVFPRGAKADDPFRAKISALNRLLDEFGKVPGITFVDLGPRFLAADGQLPRSLMSDFCHPTEQGYAIWTAALKPLLQPGKAGSGAILGPAAAKNSSGWGVRPVLVAEAKLPRVLLVGDSILSGYHGKAAGLLRDRVSLDVWITPKHIGVRDLPDEMKAILAEHFYDVILFNDIGLHAWEPGRIPEGQYEPLMRAHLANLRKFAPRAKLIWASTTPMTTKTRPIALDPKFNPLIVQRNQIVAAIMKENQVPIADYYGLLATKLDLAAGDRFHWTAPAYEVLARCAAARLAEALGISLPGN